MQVERQLNKYKPLLIVSFFLAIIGWFETRNSVILFLNNQDPVVDFLLWYLVFGAFLYGLGKLLFKKHTKHQRVLAVLLIIFAVDIVAYWPASGLVNQVTNTNGSNLLLASEDGITYEFYQHLGFSQELSANLTHIATPIVLLIIAFYLIGPAKFTEVLRQILT